jgi:hypothetical protein
VSEGASDKTGPRWRRRVQLRGIEASGESRMRQDTAPPKVAQIWGAEKKIRLNQSLHLLAYIASSAVDAVHHKADRSRFSALPTAIAQPTR